MSETAVEFRMGVDERLWKSDIVGIIAQHALVGFESIKELPIREFVDRNGLGNATNEVSAIATAVKGRILCMTNSETECENDHRESGEV
jgi:hypothetical protein